MKKIRFRLSEGRAERELERDDAFRASVSKRLGGSASQRMSKHQERKSNQNKKTYDQTKPRENNDGSKDKRSTTCVGDKIEQGMERSKAVRLCSRMKNGNDKRSKDAAAENKAHLLKKKSVQDATSKASDDIKAACRKNPKNPACLQRRSKSGGGFNRNVISRFR